MIKIIDGRKFELRSAGGDNPCSKCCVTTLGWLCKELLNDCGITGYFVEVASEETMEDLYEQLYWEFDDKRKNSGDERLAFKAKLRWLTQHVKDQE